MLKGVSSTLSTRLRDLSPLKLTNQGALLLSGKVGEQSDAPAGLFVLGALFYDNPDRLAVVEWSGRRPVSTSGV